eukprot:CAMPEP_0119047758 /NCGR_PEP_ID=MMETSP1177-20130426/54836_1 /TAXON_ID=2985 /ORGANISM="Ochromonas sp, Strain CCMP1899" /LENGTH=36 /DNA_ID= /DNA_START= /DNA_END= /DNA_ORIENTATION=
MAVEESQSLGDYLSTYAVTGSSSNKNYPPGGEASMG